MKAIVPNGSREELSFLEIRDLSTNIQADIRNDDDVVIGRASDLGHSRRAPAATFLHERIEP